MSPNRYTELFFLDEATSFAAGHRPCFECRREDAKKFKSCWLKGNPEYGFDEDTRIGEIDDILQKERIGRRGEKVTYTAIIKDLSDGAFVEWEGRACLLAGGKLFPWSPFGYEKEYILPGEQQVKVLTPRSSVKAIQAGYTPTISDDRIFPGHFNGHSMAVPSPGTPSS